MNRTVKVYPFKRDALNLPFWADHCMTLPDKEKEEYLLKKADEMYKGYYLGMTGYSHKIPMEFSAYAQALLADANAYIHKRQLKADRLALKQAKADLAAQKRQLALDKRRLLEHELEVKDEQLASAASTPKRKITLEEMRLRNRQYQAKFQAKARLAKMNALRIKHNDDLNL